MGCGTSSSTTGRDKERTVEEKASSTAPDNSALEDCDTTVEQLGNPNEVPESFEEFRRDTLEGEPRWELPHLASTVSSQRSQRQVSSSGDGIRGCTEDGDGRRVTNTGRVMHLKPLERTSGAEVYSREGDNPLSSVECGGSKSGDPSLFLRAKTPDTSGRSGSGSTQTVSIQSGHRRSKLERQIEETMEAVLCGSPV